VDARYVRVPSGVHQEANGGLCAIRVAGDTDVHNMNTGDLINVDMHVYRKWLHAHHDVRNSSCAEDMYSFAGVNPVHKDYVRPSMLNKDGFVTLEIVDPRKYLAAKLRYGI
jgi:hypothetical protein